MANKYSVTNCRTGYKGGEKPELLTKWEVFVNRKDWTPTELR